MKMIGWLERHDKVSLGITILIAIFIFYISSLTFGDVQASGGSDIKATLYHILVFFIFAFFLFISLSRGKDKGLIFLGIILSSAYAFLDEFHQLFVPGRYGSLSDVFLDFMGISIAGLGYFILIRVREVRKE